MLPARWSCTVLQYSTHCLWPSVLPHHQKLSNEPWTRGQIVKPTWDCLMQWDIVLKLCSYFYTVYIVYDLCCVWQFLLNGYWLAGWLTGWLAGYLAGSLYFGSSTPVLDREDARKKTWWDCVKNVMESLGLSQKDAQSRNKWWRRIKWATC